MKTLGMEGTQYRAGPGLQPQAPNILLCFQRFISALTHSPLPAAM
jgi:hypothetical protein